MASHIVKRIRRDYKEFTPAWGVSINYTWDFFSSKKVPLNFIQTFYEDKKPRITPNKVFTCGKTIHTTYKRIFNKKIY